MTAPHERIERRSLGRSLLRVWRLSLGCWRTFERLSLEQGVAVMTRAQAGEVIESEISGLWRQRNECVVVADRGD